MRRVLVLALTVCAISITTSQAAELIVLNKAEASASVLDLATGEERYRVDTGSGPHEAAVSPDGKLAVVCNYGDRAGAGNTLTVFTVADGSIVRTIDLGEYARPHGIEYFDDGVHVAVTAEAVQAMVVVNVETGEVTKSIKTEAAISHMVAMTPDESLAFVANIGSGSVTVLDVAEGKKLKDVATGDGAEGVDVTPDGKEAWITNRGADTISVVDVASLEVTATIACGQFPIRLKFTPDGKRALVSNARSGDLAILDTATHQEIARISMDAAALSDKEGRLFSDQFGDSPVPVGILIEPTGAFAYVANTNADIVTEIDLEKLAITRRLATGKEPDGMAFVPGS